jgi:hypothetical protein
MVGLPQPLVGSKSGALGPGTTEGPAAKAPFTQAKITGERTATDFSPFGARKLKWSPPFASGCAGLFRGSKCQEGGAELPTSLDDISHLGAKIALYPPTLVDSRLDKKATVLALKS